MAQPHPYFWKELLTMSLSWQVALKCSSQTMPLKAEQTNEQPVSQTFGKHQPQTDAITGCNQVAWDLFEEFTSEMKHVGYFSIPNFSLKAIWEVSVKIYING